MESQGTGFTIKEILKQVDLSCLILDDSEDDDICKIDSRSPMMNARAKNPESAFLGPRLWKKPVQVPMTGSEETEDYAVMNIDDFLCENGFDVPSPEASSHGAASPTSSVDLDNLPQPKQHGKKQPEEPTGKKELNFLYAESKRARLEREKEEKRKRALELEFSPQELALATVPGMEFDPRERSFAVEELRPQPIIRKRKKAFVPSEEKDNKYWEKRIKNNVAARRSREARRLKENQIALRTAFLEKQNCQLQATLEDTKSKNLELMAEKQLLLEKLKQYVPEEPF